MRASTSQLLPQPLLEVCVWLHTHIQKLAMCKMSYPGWCPCMSECGRSSCSANTLSVLAVEKTSTAATFAGSGGLHPLSQQKDLLSMSSKLMQKVIYLLRMVML